MREIDAIEMECDSCKGEFLVKQINDSLCMGCGIRVCMTCSCVFDHFGLGEHGRGNPTDRMEKLRKLVNG